MGLVIALLRQRDSFSLVRPFAALPSLSVFPFYFFFLPDALADMEAALRVDPNNQMALQALTRIKRSMKAMGM